MQRVELYRFPTSAPDDVSGLAAQLDAGAIDPANVIAVLGKTEGNGCVNDFTRGFATTSYATLLEPAAVHFVQIKCPLLTAEEITEATAKGHRVATTSTYASMGYSRAAAALGVARALDEIPAAALSDGVIAKRWDLFSRVAS